MDELTEFWNRLNVPTDTGWTLFWIAIGLLAVIAIFGRKP
jgi:hypothetical protein